MPYPARWQVTETSNHYYVYAIKVDGLIRYIGKGTGARSARHLWNAQNVIRLRGAGKRPSRRLSYFQKKMVEAVEANSLIETVFIAKGLAEEEAYDREIVEIGNHDQLWNVLPGGMGKTSEQLRSEYAADPTRAERLGASSKKAWADPESRARRLANIKASWSKKTEDELKQFGEAVSKGHANERVRAAKREALRRRHEANRPNTVEYRLLELMKHNPTISTKEATAQIKTTKTSVQMARRRLRKQGALPKRDAPPWIAVVEQIRIAPGIRFDEIVAKLKLSKVAIETGLTVARRDKGLIKSVNKGYYLTDATIEYIPPWKAISDQVRMQPGMTFADIVAKLNLSSRVQFDNGVSKCKRKRLIYCVERRWYPTNGMEIAA